MSLPYETFEGSDTPSLDRVRRHHAAGVAAVQTEGAERWQGKADEARRRVIDGNPRPGFVARGVKPFDDLLAEKKIPPPPTQGWHPQRTYERMLEKWNEKLAQVKGNRYTEARNAGFTEAQAGVYSEAFYPDGEKSREYEKRLRDEYPGDPELADAMVDTLKTAGDAKGVHTAPILEYNRLTRENPFASTKKENDETEKSNRR